MASTQQSGRPGGGPAFAVVALAVLVAHADRAWVTFLLVVVVLYGLAVDWRSRRR